MHVCLTSTEIFLWGKHGGFGRATRMIGRELARRGIKVSAVVPLPRGERHPVHETVDGIDIHGYPPRRIWQSRDLYRQVDADVYHTQEPFLGTYLARRAMPDSVHVVTVRDPRLIRDWWIEFTYPTRSPLQVATTYLFYENPLARAAVREADAHAVPAGFLAAKARVKYRLPNDPIFLPTPVIVPPEAEKSERPTVCFVGRIDRVKRPELFFRLARSNPSVQFLAVGGTQNEGFQRRISSDVHRTGNLHVIGFVDQFRSNRLSEALAKSWILINTSAKEAMPNAFIEAAAHGCALLSPFDPDGLCSRFGRVVRDGDFDAGLQDLLRDDRWRALGQAARAHVSEHFGADIAIDRHVALYESLLAGRRRTTP